MYAFYRRSPAQLFNSEGILVGEGYSGHDEGKNNPSLENVHNVGPIPRGRYDIGEPFNSPEHGPLAMPLTPQPGTDTFGRSGFLMHGDSIEHPGEASLGCIIMPHDVRELVANGADKELQVV